METVENPEELKIIPIKKMTPFDVNPHSVPQTTLEAMGYSGHCTLCLERYTNRLFNEDYRDPDCKQIDTSETVERFHRCMLELLGVETFKGITEEHIQRFKTECQERWNSISNNRTCYVTRIVYDNAIMTVHVMYHKSWIYWSCVSYTAAKLYPVLKAAKA